MDVSEVFRENLNHLFEAYKANGGTQESLAIKAGANQSQISLWRRGTLPSLEKLPGLAHALGVRVDTLLQKDGWKVSPERERLVALILAANDAQIAALAPILDTQLAGAGLQGASGKRQD